MKPTIQINESNFESEVLKSDQPVIVDFWAEWCGPCKMLAPVLDEIAADHVGRAKIGKVNIDESPALADRYHITSIPTLLYFANGEVRDQSIGLVSRKSIIRKLYDVALREPTGLNAEPRT